MSNVYTFVDNTGFLTEVDESQLNFAGNWLATVNYFRYDVVNHNTTRYVSTTANVNTAPPPDLQFSEFWSIIAFTSTGTASSGTNTGDGASVQMVQDVYSLAYRAYTIALTGTDLPIPGGGTGSVPPWVMEWIGHTYNIARAGTDAANSADRWGRDAFALAVAGTDAAHSADMWGRDAFHIAVNGTNAANAAWNFAGQAWNIAVAGTNAAHSADSWGRDAFSLAVIGTNAADQAYSIALQALYMAWAGTDAPAPTPGGSGTVPSWVMDWLSQTYNLSVDGTNAAHSADSWARDAYGLAVTGTNAANQAYSRANQALETSWVGTHAVKSLVHCLAFTPGAIGPDAGEIVVPYNYDGATSITWDVKRLVFRVQTAGAGASAIIEKSSGTGSFSAVAVGTVSVATSAYDGFSLPLATVSSGDKMRFNVVALGTAQNWCLITEISK